MNRDSPAVSRADFVPWKSIAFAVTPAKNRDLLKSSADSEFDEVNAETRGRANKSKVKRGNPRSDLSVPNEVALGTDYEITKSRPRRRRRCPRPRRLARAPLFFLVSSNLTPGSLCRRQMPDSIEEIPKERLD